jgi:S1-C subfamily serine protease
MLTRVQILLVAVATFLLVAIGSFEGARAQPFDVERFKGNLVRIQVNKKDEDSRPRPPNFGTGFVISISSDTALILTARHLLHADNEPDFTPEIWVYFYADRLHPRAAKFLQESSNLDFAVIEVSAAGLQSIQLPKVPVRPESSQLKSGDQVYTYGSDEKFWPVVRNDVSDLRYGDRLDMFVYQGNGLRSGFSGAPILDNQGQLVGIHLGATDGQGGLGRAARATDVIKTLRELGVTSMNNLTFSNPVPASTTDCTGATAEALRLSLRGMNLARATQNLNCRPENASDEQVQSTVADMFDYSKFSASRLFLDEVWKVPAIASVDPCPLAHKAIFSANFEGLAWLFSRTGSDKLRNCNQFDGDLVSALFLVGKEQVPIVVSQLEIGGVTLQHDQYSLFRFAYEAYVGTGLPGYQWVSDVVAPPTAEAFGEAKARAEAHLVSTSRLFTEAGAPREQAWGPSYSKSREIIQKRMSDYCPQGKSYCSHTSLRGEPQVDKAAIPTQGEFIDHESKLMWTAQASEVATNWAGAGDYCKILGQGGYHDWRLPQLEELLKLVDTSQTIGSTCKRPDGQTPIFHVKRGMNPGCGDVWSGTKSQRTLSLGGFSFQYAWLFDYAKGSSKEDPTDWLGSATAYHHHVLCVRGSR